MFLDPKIVSDQRVYKTVWFLLHEIPVDVRSSIKAIRLDPNWVAIHGEWDPRTGVMLLNSVSSKETLEVGGRLVWRWVWTFAHELGHVVDTFYGNVSESPEWLRLSRWRKGQPEENEGQYDEQRPGWPQGKSPWVYSTGAKFVRDYGKRSPEEDFADTIAVCLLHIAQPINDLGEKARFVEQHILV